MQARRCATDQPADVAAHGVQGRRLHGEAQTGREFDGAQNADRIFLKADVRLADGAHQPGFEVGFAVDEVEHLARDGVVKEAVDGQVTSTGVFFDVAEDVVAGHQQIFGQVVESVGGVRAEGRGLNDLSRGKKDVGEAKASTDEAAVAKHRAHLVRMSGGGDVEVLGGAAQQQVAHAAAREVGLEALGSQALDHPQRIFVDEREGDLWLGGHGDFDVGSVAQLGFGGPFALGLGGISAAFGGDGAKV